MDKRPCYFTLGSIYFLSLIITTYYVGYYVVFRVQRVFREELRILLSISNFWTNWGSDLCSTSKWPSEPKFCERCPYSWQKMAESDCKIGHLSLCFVSKQSILWGILHFTSMVVQPPLPHYCIWIPPSLSVLLSLDAARKLFRGDSFFDSMCTYPQYSALS